MIKHSKFKNTGLIFELLVRQIAEDSMNNSDSPAVDILKKYYSGKSSLVKEFKVYDFVIKNKGISTDKANTIISTILEIATKIDEESLTKKKYNLIKEIKEHYAIDEFFSTKVRDYKALASVYCLIESHRSRKVQNPDSIVNHKLTIIEHLTRQKADKKDIQSSLIEQYASADKDVRLLTYKILLEKFNGKYGSLTSSQKSVLKEYINASDSYVKLKKVINTEFKYVVSEIKSLKRGIDDEIVAIKLNEILGNIKQLSKTDKVDDSHVIALMQYYELIDEMRTV